LVLEILRGGASRSDVVGILDDTIEVGRRLGDIPVLGSLAAFEAVIARLRVEGRQPARLIVTRPHHEFGRERLYRLMERAEAAGIGVVQLPDVVRLDAHAVGADASEPSATACGPAAVAAPFKRFIDVIGALVILMLCAPVLVVAAAAVALGVQRPVLFTQMRPGLRGRPYRLLKLRTMRDPVDGDGRVLSDEERTPWVGRVLRRTRFDELPQILNVLAGDMSLIGPRPLLASDLDAMADGGRARSAVRPGITGWAQVNGGHQLTTGEKLTLDLWYAANANLKLDLLILWRTVVMVILGERRQPAVIADARASLAAERLAPAE
jgi:lipopolysaccharide/colanic/teichoic acid biosynthesis glycosyltransferase